MVIIVDEGVKDTLGKIGNAIKSGNRKAHELYDKGKAVYDYAMGNSNSLNNYDFSEDGNITDLRKTALKAYANDLEFEAKKDPNNNVLMVQFDSRKVPKNMMNRVDPSRRETNSRSLSSFITDYDSKTHTVTMILPMDGGQSAKQMQQKALDKRSKNKNESLELNESRLNLRSLIKWIKSGKIFSKSDYSIDETTSNKLGDYLSGLYDAVYEDAGKVANFITDHGIITLTDDHIYTDSRKKNKNSIDLTLMSESVDDEGELELNLDEDVLEETPGLTLSSPKVKYRDENDISGYLEININGKTYKYEVNSGVDKTPEEMATTVGKMQKYSDGKALAYLKKNMHLINESVNDEYDEDEGSDTDDRIIKIINDVYKEKGEIDSEESVREIEKRLDDDNLSVDSDHLGSMIVKSKEMIDEGFMRDLSIEKGKEFTSESGHKIVINDYNLSISAYDGSPAVRIDYSYETTDGRKGNSTCSPKDLFDMLHECTQTSNIGQHKVDSIDMIENEIPDTITESSEEKKVSFKDHHICDGCGNPLSKCTCEIAKESIDDEDSDDEDVLEEGTDNVKECPKCGKKYTEPSALSRVDNKTMICPECGQQEAIEAYINYQNSQKESQ